MTGLDWDDIRFFHEVVRQGSLVKAAKRMRVNHTTVSRRISKLERNLGARLFDRSNAGWATTTAGEAILESTGEMAELADAIRRKTFAESSELDGVVRITTGEIAFKVFVLPLLATLSDRQPRISLEIITSSTSLDLGTREADIAIRFTADPPENTIGKRIATVAHGIYGTAELVRQYRARPAGGDIPLLTWRGDGATLPVWICRRFPDARRIHRFTSTTTMVEAAKLGMGIARLPAMLCDPDPCLELIAADQSAPDFAIWVLSHVDLRTTARVRFVRDLIVDELDSRRALIEGQWPEKESSGP
jgi:DNA-binding transcriptional LysR family regulator